MFSFIQRPVNRGMRVFILIWFGQLISRTGSGLTLFALGVWVLQRTGSATQFALIYFFLMLPGILISPLAGALVDRWDRRWAMILSDTGVAIMTLAIALLLIADSLEIWHIYLAAVISSLFNAFQWPAYTATITLLVPKQHLGRAGGMTKIGDSVAQLISPALSGVLLMFIQLQGIILLDAATFLFATMTLLLVRFPHVKTLISDQTKKSLLHEAAYGWYYIKARSGLLGLLILSAINNFLMQTAGVLFTPLILSFTSVTLLGTILSIGGFGMLIGSLVMSIWGGPRRLIYGVFGFQLLGGLCFLVIGLHTIVPLLAVSIFLFFFGVPIIYGCDQALWQKKVAPDVQGKVFSMKRMIDFSPILLAYLIAGPLADYMFEPLMAPNGYLAGSIGQIIGVGPGRGIGLLFIIMGTLALLATVIAYQYPRLRQVEEDLPDVIVDVQESPKNQQA